jgi:5-methyltetrahydrofolate--homocysteine methyltransferase
MDILTRRVFILDGAMGTNIQALGLGSGEYKGKLGCNEYLNLVKPEIVRNIHKSFIEVGCMGVETNTMGASRLKLREYSLEDELEDINVQAAKLAREAAESLERDIIVFGAMGPTGMLPSSNDPDLGAVTFSELVVVFEEQASALLKGGVDALLIETSQDILEVKASVRGCKLAIGASGRNVPVIAQMSLDSTGRMLMGTDIGSALVTLEGMGVDVIGINCSTGPDEMRDSVRFLCEHSPMPVSSLPNMGIPRNADGVPVYPLEPEEFALAMEEFAGRLGVGIVGGCCGSTPEHLRALVARIEHLPIKKRRIKRLRAVSSAMTYLPLEQEPPPLLVGERVNAQGSRKMKQLLLADDLDGIAEIARSQAEKGAHAIDVCVALNELEGESERFLRLAKELALKVSAPIMVDSTDGEVIRKAIENYPGRVIVNSINLENGEERIDEIGETIRDYGAYVIALTIDEKGMARTRGEKAAVAERIADILSRKYDIGPERIIFDPLTFTLATGEEQYRDSAVETLEAIADIKKAVPGSLTILGVSNVSFGLSKPARAVLNSVFLYHAISHGLDLAIVNPADITPYPELSEEARSLAEDLILNRRDEALASYIAYFEGRKKEKKKEPSRTFAGPEEEIHYKILNRRAENIEALIDRVLERKDPVEVLNTVLLPAMKEVGDKFGSGELILPFVLQSAEVMKAAVSHLERFMEKKKGYSKGKVVLATVYGDVHDIGKNLVRTILSNNGYEVVDLGKQVPAGEIVDAAGRLGADAIGLSALLVSTSRQMPVVVQEMHRAGIDIPVIVGGAAVTRQFARRSAVLEDGTQYPGGLFYAKDAFEGLGVLDKLTDPAKREKLLDDYTSEVRAAAERTAPTRRTGGASARTTTDIESVDPPEPPFWGVRLLEDIDLDEVYACMDLKSLYRLSWGVRHMGKPDYEKIIKERFEPLRLELQEEAKRKRLLLPGVVYGYFPCRAEGDKLIIYDPDDGQREIETMNFPRQDSKKRLSITDYFRSDRLDVLALQLVTIGARVGEVCEEWNSAGEYSRSYFLHGLSVEAAEGLAEYTHRLIKKELGIPPDRGKRYSHGYPACPDLADNAKILRLLDGEKHLGVVLTPAFQFVPEQTTAALVVHHPQAEYFSV